MFNKKGSFENFVPAAIFLFVAVIGIFFFTTSDSAAKEKQNADVQRQMDYLYAHQALLNYLGKNDDSGDNRADLITKNYFNNNYAELENDIKRYFSSNFGHFQKWRFQIMDSSRNTLYSVEEGIRTEIDIEFEAASATIPIPFDDYLIIKISLVRTGAIYKLR